MKHQYLTAVTLLLTATLSEAALAYVGPGAGLSLLGALWGLLLAIGAAIAFVILWPIRKARRNARAKRELEAAATADAVNVVDDR